ncbi:MAG: T9SS type A sorting domain-containing protein [Bacteroidales bacterium]|nr:T9SS type A sorting domain-containing protein [Bacteroidales bacterium]
MKKITLIALTLVLAGFFLVFSSYAQNAGDYRTKSSGKWKNKNSWEIYNGSSWVNASVYPSDRNATITIRSGHTIELDANRPEVFDLIVETTAKFYRNNSVSFKNIRIFGSVLCDGVIGNGPIVDAITFNVEGSTCYILGSGDCRVYDILKTTNVNAQTQLVILTDIEIYRTNQKAISNGVNNTILDIYVYPGVNITTHTKIDLSDCSLFLKADQNGDVASLICPDITNSDETNTTVQRYIEEDMWHYVSSPVDDVNTGVFLNTYLKWFYEPDSTWTYIFNSDSILATDMEGYALWAASWITGSKMINFKGELNSGAKSIGVTRTAGAPHNSKGFNFVGNPYPSSLNWNIDDGWTKTRVDASIHMWNPAVGNYGVYVEDASIGTNDVDSIIPPHQGFFVHANSAAGTLGVDFDAQVHSTKAFFKNGNLQNDDLYLFTVNGNNYSDQMLIRFDNNSSGKYDGQYDGLKFFGLNAAPQIYTVNNENLKFSVNTVPLSNRVDFPVGFEFGAEGIYTISCQIDQNVGGPWLNPVLLEDLKEGIIHNFKESPEYQFTANNGDDPGRFILHFIHDLGAIGKAGDEINSNVRVFAFGETVYVNSEEAVSGSFVIYNLLGQQVFNREMVNSTSLTINPELNDGYYLVVLRTDEKIISEKLYIE